MSIVETPATVPWAYIGLTRTILCDGFSVACEGFWQNHDSCK